MMIHVSLYVFHCSYIRNNIIIIIHNVMHSIIMYMNIDRWSSYVLE